MLEFFKKNRELLAVLLLLLGVAVAGNILTKKIKNTKVETEITYKTGLVPNQGITSETPLLNEVAIKVSRLDTPPDRTILMIGPVDAILVTTVQAKLNELEQSDGPIYLVINSPGGSVLDGSQLITSIQNSKQPVKTVCSGVCASMAAIIFEYGQERLIVDRSVLMFHDAAGGADGFVPHQKSLIDFVDRYTKKQDEYIANRSKLPLEQFLVMVNRNIWIDGADAVSSHLADKLVSLHTKPSLMNNLIDRSNEAIKLKNLIGQ